MKFGKELGVSVTAEVCPHHFSMSEDEIPCDDANYKMNPPLRGKEDVEICTLDTFSAFSISHAIFSGESIAGFVFGIGQIPVKPPCAAAFEPIVLRQIMK